MKNEREIFLIDSNSLMTPCRFYYAFDLVPAYWKELAKHIDSGQVVILDMVKDEIEKGQDELAEWIKGNNALKIISHVSDETIKKYQDIMQYIGASGFYRDTALHTWAQAYIADPWLIAAAEANGYTIVTEEVPSGGLSRKTPNKSAKIPDVALHFGVKTIGVFELMRKLNIRIDK